MKFKIDYRRTYTIIEGFERVIEADDQEMALTIAQRMCRAYDENCPDDCSEITSDGAGAFDVGDFFRVADDTPVDDEEY